MTIKICFVCPYCYPLFNSQIRTMFGGWEVRISQIAKGLARCADYQVSIIVADYGQPHVETRDGVELISWPGKQFFGIKRSVDEEAGETMNPVVQVSPMPVETKPTTSRLRSALRPFKKAYKERIPWRVRIIVTGLIIGAKEGARYLIKRWLELLKATIRAPLEAARIFYHRLREPVSLAKHAFGHIGDEPVMRENIRIFEEANADIYIVPGNSRISAHAALYTKAVNKAFIMLAGSDMDFDPAIIEEPDEGDIYGEPYTIKRYAIDHAGMIIVQHERQAQMVAQFGRSAVVIGNPISMERVFVRTEKPETILWVGNTDERVKRPSLMLEIARSLPEYFFIMIITPVVEDDYQRLNDLAQSIPNVQILSRIPFQEIEKYFAQAKLFINTSTFEGFPNTFLQAGKYGVPVLSLKVDPNEMLSTFGCGITCADDVNRLRDSIRLFFTDAGAYHKTSERIYDYVKEHHDIERIVPKFEEAFQAVINPNGTQ